MRIIESNAINKEEHKNNQSLLPTEVISAHVQVYMSTCYEISELSTKDECERLRKKDIADYNGIIDLSNWLQIYILADQFCVLWLRNRAFKFALENFMDIVKSPGYEYIDNSILSLLLQDDNLNIECESDAFSALIKWVRFDSARRRADIDRLIDHIRMDHISEEVIIISYCLTQGCKRRKPP